MYASEAQRRFFHTATARKVGLTKEQVAEYDKASAGLELPDRVTPKSSRAHRRFGQRVMGARYAKI